MPKILSDAEHDARVGLDPTKGYILTYGIDRPICFPVSAQRLIYHVFNETEDMLEVLERLIKHLNWHANTVTLPVLQALHRRIKKGCKALDEKDTKEQAKDKKEQEEREKERAHWSNVKSVEDWRLSDQEKSDGEAALINRVIQLSIPETGIVIQCDVLINPRLSKSVKRATIDFLPQHQTFIYNATKFENLTSEATVAAFSSIFGISIKPFHVRRVFRFIDYRHSRVTSGTDEANHWEAVRRDSPDVRAEIRHHTPEEYRVQSVPRPAAPHNMYQGQSSSRSVGATEPSPFLNQQPVHQKSRDPTFERIYQEVGSTVQDELPRPRRSGPNPESRQPAAKSRRPQDTELDQILSQTTQPSKKRPASRTPDNPSPDSGVSSSSSDSSNDDPQGDDDQEKSKAKGSKPSEHENPRSQSSEEEEATRERTKIQNMVSHLVKTHNVAQEGYREGKRAGAKRSVENLAKEALDQQKRIDADFNRRRDVRRGKREGPESKMQEPSGENIGQAAPREPETQESPKKKKAPTEKNDSKSKESKRVEEKEKGTGSGRKRRG